MDIVKCKNCGITRTMEQVKEENEHSRAYSNPKDKGSSTRKLKSRAQ